MDNINLGALIMAIIWGVGGGILYNNKWVGLVAGVAFYSGAIIATLIAEGILA